MQKDITYLYDWGDASGRAELDYTVVHYGVMDGCLLCAYIILVYLVQKWNGKYREVWTYPQDFSQTN